MQDKQFSSATEERALKELNLSKQKKCLSIYFSSLFRKERKKKTTTTKLPRSIT